jgi:hypothetical protein
MTSLICKCFSYELSPQLKKDFESEILKNYQDSKEEERIKINKFLNNDALTLLHRNTWKHQEIIKKNIDFFAKFYEINRNNGNKAFQNISEVAEFILEIKNFWNFRRTIISKNFYVTVEQTIQRINEISENALRIKELFHKDYTKEQISRLIRLEGNLEVVTKYPLLVERRQIEALALIGQLDYEDSSNRPKVLVLEAYEDWNNSLDSFNSIALFEKLRSHFNTRFRIIKTLDNLNIELSLASTHKPKLIIISAHGSRSSFSLSQNEVFYWNCDIPALKSLTPGTIIILRSCSTGKGRDTRWNIANQIAYVAPQVKVFAPPWNCFGFFLFSENVIPLFFNSDNPEVAEIFTPNHLVPQYATRIKSLNSEHFITNQVKSESFYYYSPDNQKIAHQKLQLCKNTDNNRRFDRIADDYRFIINNLNSEIYLIKHCKGLLILGVVA